MEEITVVLLPSRNRKGLFDVVVHKPISFLAARDVSLDEAKRISNGLLRTFCCKESRARLEKVISEYLDPMQRR